MTVTAQQALLQLLANQGSRGARGNRFDSGVAKARLQDLLDEEERAKLRASFQPDANVEESLYGIGGARRQKRMALEAANLQHTNQLEDAARARQQQQSLQDIQFAKEQGSLRASLSPQIQAVPGQSAGASRREQYIDPTAEAGIINAQFPGRKTKGGLDITNPDHVAIARKKVEEAMKSGKGIDASELRSSIISEIQNGEIAKLRQAKDISSIQADISGSRKKIKENAKDTPGLTKSTRTKLEKDIEEGFQLGRQLDVIGKRFNEDHFNRFRKANVLALKEAEKAGKELSLANKAIVQQYTGFEGAVRRAFDRYRKLITGAAAPVQELAILEKGFLSMDFSATQFQAALKGLSALNKLGLYNKENFLTNELDIDKLTAAADNDPRIQQLLDEWNTAAGLAIDSEAPTGLSDDDRARAQAVLQRKLAEQQGQ